MKELLISIDDWEIRGAVLENRAVVELYVERRSARSIAGNIYLGTVREMVPGMEAAFVDIGRERNGFLVFRAEGVKEHEGWAPVEVLRRGQRVLAQANKEPIGAKGAQLTTRISLPGHFMVLLPNAPGLLNFSRRLAIEERERLKAALEKSLPSSVGAIVRTAAASADPGDLLREIASLSARWEQIKLKVKRASGVLLWEEAPLDQRLIRDVFSSDFARCRIDSPERADALRAYLEEVHPQLASRIHVHSEDEPLFEKYQVEEAIASALERRVPLRSGGFLAIDETEALTSVDVNTGKYIGRKSLEETALRINLEACSEIARQLRLRNIGGMIIVDFIDMRQPEHRRQVYEVFTDALAQDRAKADIVEISRLGLVEMTRKKVAGSLRDLILDPCPACRGTGRHLSRETADIQAKRQIRRICERRPAEAFLARANPETIEDLGFGGIFLDEATGKQVYLRPDPELAPGMVEMVREGSAEELAVLGGH